MPHYPSWKVLIDKLCEACDVAPPGSEELSAGEAMEKAEECQVKDAHSYYQALTDIFSSIQTQQHAAILPLLQLPFACFVTTNFDPQLSRVARILRWNDPPRCYPNGLLVAGVGSREPPPVFYLHGHVENGANTLVLSESDYRAAYEESKIVPQFLGQLLQSFDVLFIGTRLSEPGVDRAFSILRRAREQAKSLGHDMAPHDRIVLIDAPSAHLEETAEGYREQDIEPLFYDASSGFAPIVQIVDTVQDLVDVGDDALSVSTLGAPV